MTEARSLTFFKPVVPKTAALISVWILFGMNNHPKNIQQKTKSQPCFNPECAAAIDHLNHYFKSYRNARCSLKLTCFKTYRNQCNSVSKYAKCSGVRSVQTKFEKKKIKFREFWKITNENMNRSKAAVPAITNYPEVMHPSTDKVKLFASIFASNSTLDD